MYGSPLTSSFKETFRGRKAGGGERGGGGSNRHDEAQLWPLVAKDELS